MLNLCRRRVHIPCMWFVHLVGRVVPIRGIQCSARPGWSHATEMAGQFRSSVWDPVLIVAQILTIQAIFYISLGVWISVLDAILVTNRSLEQIFGFEFMIHNLQATQFRDLQGRFLMVAYLCNALTCSVGLLYVVQRTKLCWDFAVTSHIIHLVSCWVFNGFFPNTLSWWLITVISTIMMTVLGEFLCMRTEMKAIPVNIGPRADL